MTLPCPACRTSAELFLQATDLNQKVSATVFDYHRCTACGLVFLDPIPADLGRYYDLDYPPYRIPTNRAELAQAAEAFRWRVDFVREFAQRGRMLEIGPSYGGFAYLSAQAGFAVDAIEMDRKCSDFINANLPGVHAINTDNVIEAVARLEQPYDVIALWQNVEHLPDPWRVLERLAARLAPGGFLVIATPNPDSYQFRLFKKYWMHLDAPRHISLIPPAVLRGFLEKHGLRQVRFTTTDTDGVAISRAGWDVSREHVMARYTGLARWLVKRGLKLLARLVRPFEAAQQRGAGYTAVYQAKTP